MLFLSTDRNIDVSTYTTNSRKFMFLKKKQYHTQNDISDKIILIGKSWLVNFKLLNKYKKFLVEKGSVTINGVSLTISKILKDGFQISIIPQTLKLTNLMHLKEKDLVNIEFDVLGKYIKSLLK